MTTRYIINLTLFDVPSRYAAESTSGSLLFAVLREAIVVVVPKNKMSTFFAGIDLKVPATSILRALFVRVSDLCSNEVLNSFKCAKFQ